MSSVDQANQGHVRHGSTVQVIKQPNDERFKRYVDKAVRCYFESVEPRRRCRSGHRIKPLHTPLSVSFIEPTESTQAPPTTLTSKSLFDPALTPFYSPPRHFYNDNRRKIIIPTPHEDAYSSDEVTVCCEAPQEQVYQKRKRIFGNGLQMLSNFFVFAFQVAYKLLAVAGDLSCRYPTHASLIILCFGVYFALYLLEFSLVSLVGLFVRVSWPITYVSMRSWEHILRGKGLACKHLDSIYRGLHCDLARIWCTEFETMCDQRCSFADSALNQMAYS